MPVLLCFAALLVTASGSQEYRVSFRRQIFEEDVIRTPKNIACNNKVDQWRNRILDESACSLKEVYVGLSPPTTYQSLTPRSLWVKRCVGDCTLTSEAFKCLPTEVARRNVPVTLYNVKTNKYVCSTFTLEEPVACRCAAR